MRGRLFPLTLLSIGVMLVTTGIFIILYKGVEVNYTTYAIIIPEYIFETLMPGNYTKTESYSVELASIKRDTSERISWIYRTANLPWQNCTGANYVGVGFMARLAKSYNGTPRLILEIYGCRSNACEALALSDLLVSALTDYSIQKVEEMSKYYGKTEYDIQNGILDYEYFNITLTPVGLVVEDFLAGSQVTCMFQYEVTAPILTVKDYNYKSYFINIPASVNTSWLRIGMTFSLTGLTTMITSLYILVARKTQS